MSQTDLSPWVCVRCPLPADGPQADAYLTRMLGPMMNGLVRAGELGHWSFERGPADTLRVRARGTDHALLVARLAGLWLAACFATGRPEAARRRPVAIDDRATASAPAWTADALLFLHATQVALEVIASTPTRRSRLRTAFHLSLATAIEMRLSAPNTDLDARRSAPSASACTRAVCEVAPRSTHRRWQQRSDEVRAGQGPVARWARYLAGTGGATGTSAGHRVLYNQLGIGADDQRRIDGATLASLIAPARPRHPRAVDAPATGRLLTGAGCGSLRRTTG